MVSYCYFNLNSCKTLSVIQRKHNRISIRCKNFHPCLSKLSASPNRSWKYLVCAVQILKDLLYTKVNNKTIYYFRLTTDIQDFKSSLKQVISQGLRSTTQIIGCGIMLFTISHKLTYLMILILPGIILVGTGMGSVLRQISHNSQEQLALAMSVADEAIGNVRTVRAFAMEPKEIG